MKMKWTYPTFGGTLILAMLLLAGHFSADEKTGYLVAGIIIGVYLLGYFLIEEESAQAFVVILLLSCVACGAGYGDDIGFIATVLGEALYIMLLQFWNLDAVKHCWVSLLFWAVLAFSTVCCCLIPGQAFSPFEALMYGLQVGILYYFLAPKEKEKENGFLPTPAWGALLVGVEVYSIYRMFHFSFSIYLLKRMLLNLIEGCLIGSRYRPVMFAALIFMLCLSIILLWRKKNNNTVRMAAALTLVACANDIFHQNVIYYQHPLPVWMLWLFYLCFALFHEEEIEPLIEHLHLMLEEDELDEDEPEEDEETGIDIRNKIRRLTFDELCSELWEKYNEEHKEPLP